MEYDLMLRNCKLGFLSLLIFCSSSLHAEFIIDDFGPQNGTRTTTGGFRSTYLGRFNFTGDVLPPTTTPFENITAGVTIGNAKNANVQLFSGFSANPSTSFGTGLPTGVFDTGVRFSTDNEQGYEAQIVSNFALDPTIGYGLRNSLATHGGLDFWLVTPISANSLYDAPAGSTTPFANGFGVSLTAVPEPSSLALVILSGAAAVGFARRRVVNRKRTTES